MKLAITIVFNRQTAYTIIIINILSLLKYIVGILYHCKLLIRKITTIYKKKNMSDAQKNKTIRNNRENILRS